MSPMGAGSPAALPGKGEAPVTDMPFTDVDLAQIRARDMSPMDVQAQLETFRKGFPNAVLDRPCTVGDGIRRLDQGEIERLTKRFDAAAREGRARKFVPASGAASRMFKLPLSALNETDPILDTDLAQKAEKGDGESARLLHFLREIRTLALYGDLRRAMAGDGIDADRLFEQGRYEDLLVYLLTPRGLDAAGMPKGLIPFHAYGDGSCRTPFEEQLVEAALTVRDGAGKAAIHFTVSPAHEEAIRRHLIEGAARLEGEGTEFRIDVSLQTGRTDTIAVDLENRPFRDDDGRLLFRPGGHGALLENLNALDGDVVFIKNIDNVVPDRLKETTVTYKKALGGVLVEIQEEIFAHIGALSNDASADRSLDRAWDFVVERLSVCPPKGIESDNSKRRRAFLLSRLNRPLRICGMVRNEGEPGGGPFWVRQRDGGLSLQIVESSQVDMALEAQKEIWESSTHFNPVDLVCGLSDYTGRSFDLKAFRDPETGFISMKSKGGRDVKALELPGLWNGAMADWNTLFVEVPIETFNPVKTVMDLLRDEHRAA